MLSSYVAPPAAAQSPSVTLQNSPTVCCRFGLQTHSRWRSDQARCRCRSLLHCEPLPNLASPFFLFAVPHSLQWGLGYGSSAASLISCRLYLASFERVSSRSCSRCHLLDSVDSFWAHDCLSYRLHCTRKRPKLASPALRIPRSPLFALLSAVHRLELPTKHPLAHH